jgi:CRISPR-associated protein Cas2
MSMTVVVVTNVARRFHGFLASCMLEIAPGVYAAPKLNKGVRERVWDVCSEWFTDIPGTSIVMVWNDPSESGGYGIATLGVPARTFVEHEGLVLVKRELIQEEGSAG